MPFKIASANKDLKNGIVVLENTDPAADLTKITFSPYTREIMLVVNSRQALTQIDEEEYLTNMLENQVYIPHPFSPTTVTFLWSESKCQLLGSFICSTLEKKYDSNTFALLQNFLIKGINMSFESHIDHLLKEKNYKDEIINFVNHVKAHGIPESETRLMKCLASREEQIKDIFIEHYAEKFIKDFDAQVKGTVEYKTEVKSDQLDVKDTPPPKPKKKTSEEILQDGFAEAARLNEIFGGKVWLKFGNYLQKAGLFAKALEAYNKITNTSTNKLIYEQAKFQCANIYYNNWGQVTSPKPTGPNAEAKKVVKSLDEDDYDILTPEELTKVKSLQQALRDAVNSEDQKLALTIANSLVAPDVLKGPPVNSSYSIEASLTKENVELFIELLDKERERNRKEMNKEPAQPQPQTQPVVKRRFSL